MSQVQHESDWSWLDDPRWNEIVLLALDKCEDFLDTGSDWARQEVCAMFSTMCEREGAKRLSVDETRAAIRRQRNDVLAKM